MAEHTTLLKSLQFITQPACLSCSSSEQDNNISVFKYTKPIQAREPPSRKKEKETPTGLYKEQGGMETVKLKNKDKKNKSKGTLHRCSRGY